MTSLKPRVVRKLKERVTRLRARAAKLKARAEAIKPRIKEQTYEYELIVKLASAKYYISRVSENFNFFYFLAIIISSDFST